MIAGWTAKCPNYSGLTGSFSHTGKGFIPSAVFGGLDTKGEIQTAFSTMKPISLTVKTFRTSTYGSTTADGAEIECVTNPAFVPS